MGLYNFSKIDHAANTLIGVPYMDVGRDVSKGLDCWGMVIHFFRLIGIKLPEYVQVYDYNWWKKANFIEENSDDLFVEVDDLQPADVIGMKINGSLVENHLCIYLPQNRVLNTDRIVGIHRTRLFVLQAFVSSYKRYRDLVA